MRAYIHIPFCRQRCGYCHFALTTSWDEARIARYCARILQNIDDFFDGLGPVLPSEELISTLYFGWGTPSAIAPRYIDMILQKLASRRDFTTNVEITMEANPEDITPDWIAAVENIGVTRCSVGVQSLHAPTLHTIGRSDPQTIHRALELLSASSIAVIGTDWIVGLPHEINLLHDMQSVLGLYRVDHMSVYLLEQAEKYPKPWDILRPSEELMRESFLALQSELLARWFEHYEISNFARPGKASRHNRWYWGHSEIAAFGLSAAGFDGKATRYQYDASFANFYEGKYSSEQLTSEQVSLEKLMFGIRTFSLPVETIHDTQALESIRASGLVDVINDQIVLTSTGLFLTDHIITALA